MRYPVDTPQQLRAVIKALRQARRMTQSRLGERLGVNQKRIARIEAQPQLTGFDQIARLIASLDGRLVVEVDEVGTDDARTATVAASPQEPRRDEPW